MTTTGSSQSAHGSIPVNKDNNKSGTVAYLASPPDRTLCVSGSDSYCVPTTTIVLVPVLQL